MHLVKTTTPDNHAREQIAHRQLRFKLASLVQTSEQMLGFAQDKNWDKVDELEQKRHQDLRELETLPDAITLTADVSEAYRSVIDINARIADLLSSEKAGVVDAYQAARGKARAAQLYKSM